VMPSNAPDEIGMYSEQALINNVAIIASVARCALVHRARVVLSRLIVIGAILSFITTHPPGGEPRGTSYAS
jgi:hypothetical protein